MADRYGNLNLGLEEKYLPYDPDRPYSAYNAPASAGAQPTGIKGASTGARAGEIPAVRPGLTGVGQPEQAAALPSVQTSALPPTFGEFLQTIPKDQLAEKTERLSNMGIFRGAARGLADVMATPPRTVPFSGAESFGLGLKAGLQGMDTERALEEQAREKAAMREGRRIRAGLQGLQAKKAMQEIEAFETPQAKREAEQTIKLGEKEYERKVEQEAIKDVAPLLEKAYPGLDMGLLSGNIADLPKDIRSDLLKGLSKKEKKSLGDKISSDFANELAAQGVENFEDATPAQKTKALKMIDTKEIAKKASERKSAIRDKIDVFEEKIGRKATPKELSDMLGVTDRVAIDVKRKYDRLDELQTNIDKANLNIKLADTEPDEDIALKTKNAWRSERSRLVNERELLKSELSKKPEDVATSIDPLGILGE